MRRSIFGIGVFFVLFIYQAQSVWADATEAREAYTEGRRAYQGYDYGKASQALTKAIQGRCRFLPGAMCKEALRLLALSFYNDGKRGPAAVTWAELLRRDPSSKLPPDQSPAVEAFFAAIKQKVLASTTVRVAPPLPPPRYIPPPRRVELSASSEPLIAGLEGTIRPARPVSVAPPTMWQIHGVSWSVGGVAVLLGVGGMIAGIVFLQQDRAWDALWQKARRDGWASGRSQADLASALAADPLYHSARASGIASIVLFSSAGAALATGGVLFALEMLWIRSKPRKPPPPLPTETARLLWGGL